MKASAKRIAVIGSGPAGLMVAERIATAGVSVTIFERMPSVGRKLLMAGRGGLNLTHSEPAEKFITRYGEADPRLIAALQAFPAAAAVAWAEGLGQPTFIGSSGRVFPKSMKASPLLRAWLARLRDAGVVIRTRVRWLGWAADGALRLHDDATGDFSERFDGTILALGGASWPRLGSDATWVPVLAADGVAIEPLQPANVGVLTDWSDFLREKFAGQPLKRIALTIGERRVRGEAMITRTGLEGGAIYVAGEAIRAVLSNGPAEIIIDLRPDLATEPLAERLAEAPSKQSLGNTLRKAAGLDAAAVALLNEAAGKANPLPRTPIELAMRIKAVPLVVTGFAGMDRAISTAGGVAFNSLDDHFMLRTRPGVFIAGEMLDWTAPTGGYLLQACLATGIAAADGARSWLDRQAP
jgi:uncharacterized flavoprotein (TIGR03862 family)